MDREAEFRRLYEAHRAAVHAYFTGRTSDSQSAADLMQDVFLRVWQHLDKLTDMTDDGQRAWIFTVARNLSVDVHRHQHTQVGAERALAREPERLAVVGEAIRRLPEPQRVTLTMAAAGEMTSTEIAAALGVAAGTVRYRLSLARHTLAEALDRYDDPREE